MNHLSGIARAQSTSTPEPQARLQGKIASFRTIEIPLQKDWIGQVEAFSKKGYVEEDILNMILHMTHWHGIASSRPFYGFFKRMFDIVVSAMLIVLLSPVLLACAAAVRLTSKGPAVFSQVRIGHYGRPFWIYKFRTMEVGAQGSRPIISELHAPLKQRDDDPRVSNRVMSFLRGHKLDELPQLFNVLKGEMSMVGPRPLTPCDSSTVPPEYLTRFAVKPGMTGLWQASAPELTDGIKKLAYDCRYVQRRTLALDAKLVAQTAIIPLVGVKLEK